MQDAAAKLTDAFSDSTTSSQLLAVLWPWPHFRTFHRPVKDWRPGMCSEMDGFAEAGFFAHLGPSCSPRS